MTRENNHTEAVLVLANSEIEIMVEQSCYSLGYCKPQAASSGKGPEEELSGPRQNF